MNGIFARQLFIRYTFNQGSLVYTKLPYTRDNTGNLVYTKLPVLSRVYGS